MVARFEAPKVGVIRWATAVTSSGTSPIAAAGSSKPNRS